MNSTITVGRSNVTLAGGGVTRGEVKLVRAYNFADPLIRVASAGPAITGVTLQNFTVCGSDTLPLGTEAPVSGCPRVETGECRLRTVNWNTSPWKERGQCVDVEVDNVDAAQFGNLNPFSAQGPYSLTIAGVDFEDATGHALSLYNNAGQTKLNDVYIHDNAFNNSAVTGIVYGTNGAGAAHTSPVCDSNPIFKNDPNVFAPRNIRIENNTFLDNNTGAMGGGAMRWVLLQNNQFRINYRNPQAGDAIGGTIEFDPCADKLNILGNTLIGPSYLHTDGMELYSRSMTIQGNTVSGYAREGIGLHSAIDAIVTGNTLTGNGGFISTGGIMVASVESIQGPCVDARDTRLLSLSGNNSTGQIYGIHLLDHDDFNSNRVYDITVGSTQGGVGVDSLIKILGNSAVGQFSPLPSLGGPRTLPMLPVNPAKPRCSTQPLGTRQVFSFPVANASGKANITSVEVVFSVTGADDSGAGGPDNGALGCHFFYQNSGARVWLDGPGGGFNWIGSSQLGLGIGTDISNGYCTIHAGSASSGYTTDPNDLYNSQLNLDIEFPSSNSSGARKHIYSVVTNLGQVSNSGNWRYWGWWATQ